MNNHIGGYARAKSLSPERRSQIAREAANARWKKSLHHDKKLDSLVFAYNVKKISIESRIFGKLLKGQTVVLGVEDSKLPKKRRIRYTLIYFVPLGNSRVLVALPGYSSEVFTLDKQLKPITFMMLGLNSTLSKALTNALIGLL